MDYPKLSPDELAARYIYPALRAKVASLLITQHGYTQQRAAELLGVTQSAISQYMRKRRALWRELLTDEIVDKASIHLAQELVSKSLDQYATTIRLTQLVNYILEHRVACYLHKEAEPQLDVEKCHICDEKHPTQLIQILSKPPS